MSSLHRFLFEGLPVRGALVRLTDAWTEVLARRAQGGAHPPYAPAVRDLLGELTAAACLMQANIKFNGSLVLQVHGDGPVRLAVAEVGSDLSLRATATVTGDIDPGVGFADLVNRNNQGRCAITLDPRDRLPGQQAYQGVVPLFGDRGERLDRVSLVLQHYMLQSEQLDTCLVLAADAEVAAGLLVQRLPVQGAGNLESERLRQAQEDAIGRDEDYRRIALLASSLQRDELLRLDADTLLRRLFWQEDVRRFDPVTGPQGPRFRCRCSRERVGRMIVGLGRSEAQDILGERGVVEVGCDFCGLQYRFDAIDVERLFTPPGDAPPANQPVH
ncbi:MAG: Hsp33 family molecular chaperone HslO [Rhodoferax sp.]|nr:Hsp33 family molecular chaperone HslO [Rhodoferax sp.]